MDGSGPEGFRQAFRVSMKSGLEGRNNMMLAIIDADRRDESQ